MSWAFSSQNSLFGQQNKRPARQESNSLNPQAPPPAAPPPPPPGTPGYQVEGLFQFNSSSGSINSSQRQEQQQLDPLLSSYQNSYPQHYYQDAEDNEKNRTPSFYRKNSYGSRQAQQQQQQQQPVYRPSRPQPIMIHNYETSTTVATQLQETKAKQPASVEQQKSISLDPEGQGFSADPNIRPNTGETNSSAGYSASETVRKLRMLNLLSCSVALLLEIPNILGHIIFLQPARAVLGGYLMFFSLVICFQEFKTPWIKDRIKEQLGFVEHPFGKSFMLVMMGGMALGQDTLIDYLLGSAFLFSALYTLYAFCRYPEFRRMEADQKDLLEGSEGLRGAAMKYAWTSTRLATETVNLI